MHDVTPFLYPRSVPAALRVRYRRQLSETLQHSRRVIAVSQILFSALSIHARLNPAKVRVIHNGVSERFAPQTDPVVLAAARQRYSLPERFAFWAGDFRPEKNLRFIKAWARSAAPGRPAGAGTRRGAEVRLAMRNGWSREAGGKVSVLLMMRTCRLCIPRPRCSCPCWRRASAYPPRGHGLRHAPRGF